MTNAWADDGGVDAVGGSVRLMENVPGISMQAEFVHGFAEWLSYQLWTGASWEGRIGSADIVITVADPDGHYDLSATPGGFSNSQNEFRWHFENFEPAQSDSPGKVRVTWIKRT